MRTALVACLTFASLLTAAGSSLALVEAIGFVGTTAQGAVDEAAGQAAVLSEAGQSTAEGLVLQAEGAGSDVGAKVGAAVHVARAVADNAAGQAHAAAHLAAHTADGARAATADALHALSHLLANGPGAIPLGNGACHADWPGFPGLDGTQAGLRALCHGAASDLGL